MARTNYKNHQDFMYEIKDGEVSILKYTGGSEEVTIPSCIDGMPVTKINASLVASPGFCNSDTLKRVCIPEGVKEIAMVSFSYSKSLESVTIPASVTKMSNSVFSGSEFLANITVDEHNQVYASVDGVLFSKDKTKLVYFPLGKAYETGGDIPEGKMRPLSYAMNIRGLRSQLDAYYIYQRGVTLEEFEEIIHEEHDKVWGRGEKSCFSPKMRVKTLE